MKQVVLVILGMLTPALCIAGEPAKKRDSAVYLAYTRLLPDFDRVRIYALVGNPQKGNEGFPILPYDGAVCTIASEVEVTGKDALAICAAWRRLNDDMNEAFCHNPPYGFRFYKGDEMVFQTSVCWTCHNFYGPNDEGKSVWYGLAKDKNSSHLLKLCRKLLPHPKLDK